VLFVYLPLELIQNKHGDLSNVLKFFVHKVNLNVSSCHICHIDHFHFLVGVVTVDGNWHPTKLIKLTRVVVEGQGGILPYRRRPHSGPIEL